MKAWIAGLTCSLLLSQSSAVQFAAQERKAAFPTAEVWINSFPRSASSTMLSLVRASMPDDDRIFSLFEPCHANDEMGADSKGRNFMNVNGNINCPVVVEKLAACNFTGVTDLWGWRDNHTSNFGKEYSAEFATQACRYAKRRIFKTVGATNKFDPGRLLKTISWVLDNRPQMKVLNLVRDPRSIYVSWKELDAFEDEIARRSTPLWSEMCDTFAANLNFTHPHALTVVYEKLVKDPRNYMKEIYDFLGFEFGSAQEAWVTTNFPETSHGCPSGGTWKYSDCQGRENSIKEMSAWRDVLSEKEKANFLFYEPCQQVYKAFDFPLK